MHREIPKNNSILDSGFSKQSNECTTECLKVKSKRSLSPDLNLDTRMWGEHKKVVDKLLQTNLNELKKCFHNFLMVMQWASYRLQNPEVYFVLFKNCTDIYKKMFLHPCTGFTSDSLSTGFEIVKQIISFGLMLQLMLQAKTTATAKSIYLTLLV